MIGSRLAHYEINGYLGTGGTREVFQATDTRLGRSVAIQSLACIVPTRRALDVEPTVALRMD